MKTSVTLTRVLLNKDELNSPIIIRYTPLYLGRSAKNNQINNAVHNAQPYSQNHLGQRVY